MVCETNNACMISHSWQKNTCWMRRTTETLRRKRGNEARTGRRRRERERKGKEMERERRRERGRMKTS